MIRKLPDFLAALFVSKKTEPLVFAIIAVLLAIGNLPWQLDNYDQAKQAYVSYEIVHGGSAWYQHTPRGDTATKPPLAGWISLGFYQLTGSWDIAWRLPGYICALVILYGLVREGQRLLPEGGAVLAACAFGLNLLTPRIATLVRTDIMLALLLGICGWLIYRKVRDGTAWTLHERIAFFAAMLAACFTKGPIIYAFILPGMVVFWFLAPKDRRHLVWSGWWTWAIPLAVFVAWLGIGIATRKEFYDDIVVKEFASRFNQSLKGDETKQWIGFYFPHLLHKFAPWSILMLALPLFSQNVRRAFNRPEVLWLACWGVGGLLCMTFVPSKRVDRIFPVISPLCLLLVAMVGACQCGRKIRAWCGGAIVGAVCMSVGYFVTIVVVGYFDKEDRMVRFGRQVQQMVAAAGISKPVVVQGKDEAMLLYCGGDTYFHPVTALRDWQAGKINALVIPERRIEGPYQLPLPELDSGPISKQGEKRYLLFIRKP